MVGLRAIEFSVLGELSVCGQLGADGEGERVYESVVREGLDCNLQVYNAVIDMFGRCGLVD